jgi:hypothetical protein
MSAKSWRFIEGYLQPRTNQPAFWGKAAGVRP